MEKIIPCPKCGSRVLDSEADVHTQTKLIDPHNPSPPKEQWPTDFIVKCWRCKARIGVRIVR